MRSGYTKIEPVYFVFFCFKANWLNCSFLRDITHKIMQDILSKYIKNPILQIVYQQNILL